MNEPWKPAAVDLDPGGAEGPYPGLRPFLPRERAIFFGREQMIDQVLVRLNERHMVVVHGASGCGKSSLIAAGVLPQLERRRARLGRVLAVRTFRPGNSPTQKLVQTLAELCGPEKQPAELDVVYRALARDKDARAEVARLAAGAGVDQLCIVVDQFEELFRFAEDGSLAEAQHFAELLVRLAGQSQDEARWWQEQSEGGPAATAEEAAPRVEISFILTMRSEFLGNCARYPGLAEAINHTQYLLPNMNRADLIRAIREPAEVFDGSVDHALAERIANDAAREEDSLPLVQHALMQMWRESADGTLTLADYEAALAASAQSAKAKQLGPLGAILAGHAGQVLAEVTGGHQAKQSAAEFIFRALTRKDSESRAIRCPQRFRRLLRLSGVSEAETRAILDGFRRDGVSFLTPYAAMDEAIEDDTVIDISHEALIRAWPRMSDKAIDDKAQPVGWVEREAQDAMLWRWLAVHADFFRSNPRAYLDGATTERLGGWFERLQVRPDWVRPHLVKSEGKDDVTQEPEWQAVDHLLKESHDKTWIDRTRLRWWRKLGWLSFVLLALAIAGAGVGLYVVRDSWQSFFQQEKAKEREDEALTKQDNRRVGASVRETTALFTVRDKIQGAAVVVEVVDQRTAEAATAGGSFITAPGGQGYIWIGTIPAAGEPIINLLGAGDRPVRPDDPPGRGRRGQGGPSPTGWYKVVRNIIVRESAPTPDGPRRSVGVIKAGTFIVIDRLVPTPVTVEGRREYWAQVRLAEVNLPRVRVLLVHVPAETGAAMSTGLTRIGYRIERLRPDAGLDAASRADVLYCHGEDRQAAVRLAATVTNWIRQNTGADIRVVPTPGDECGGVPRNQLILLLDLTPGPPAEGP